MDPPARPMSRVSSAASAAASSACRSRSRLSVASASASPVGPAAGADAAGADAAHGFGGVGDPAAALEFAEAMAVRRRTSLRSRAISLANTARASRMASRSASIMAMASAASAARSSRPAASAAVVRSSRSAMRASVVSRRFPSASSWAMATASARLAPFDTGGGVADVLVEDHGAHCGPAPPARRRRLVPRTKVQNVLITFRLPLYEQRSHATRSI